MQKVPMIRKPGHDEIKERVATLMPEIVKDLGQLISHPSVAFPGYPREPVLAMADATVAVLKRYSLEDARLLDTGGAYPSVYGEIPASPGAPTVLMYAHYDVQPARREDGWDTDPWIPVVKNGRLFGRGSSDNKSGIMIIAAALAIYGGRPPVGIKVIIDGEEETAGHLPEFITAHPDLFACDVIVVADSGSISTGEPALTTTLRGEVSCIVEVNTLDHRVHSGSFGGAAPDALVSLIRILATLHDANGRVAVSGLRIFPETELDYPEIFLRNDAGILEGVDLIGTGAVGSRLWSQPSATVIGMDVPSIPDSSNVLIPSAAAKISLRIAPDADPDRELGLLTNHLFAAAPWHCRVEVRATSRNPGFICATDGPGYTAAGTALEYAFGKKAARKGSGGSIPLLSVLRKAVPGSEFILWGAEDTSRSRSHGTCESVDIAELERYIVAQALLLQLLATGKSSGDPLR